MNIDNIDLDSVESDSFPVLLNPEEIFVLLKLISVARSALDGTDPIERNLQLNGSFLTGSLHASLYLSGFVSSLAPLAASVLQGGKQ